MPKIGPKCIGIVGSRRRDSAEDYAICTAAFKKLYRPGDTIVSGGCPKGGDVFAQMIAKEWGLTITIHYPDWDGLGRGAGFARNTLIAQQCNVLLALPAPDRTGGTEDTIKKATRLKKRIVLA